MPVRPILRCLTDDLGLKIPTIDDPLDEFDPLLRKANQQFAEPSSSRERISSIDAALTVQGESPTMARGSLDRRHWQATDGRGRLARGGQPGRFLRGSGPRRP